MESRVEKRKRLLKSSVWLTLIGVTIGLCVLLILYWEYLSQFQSLIYVGLFFIGVLAGSPLPIPTPCMALTFTLGSQFNPALIGFISGSGAAIGSMLIYFTARTGRSFFPNLNISDPANKIYNGAIGKFLRKIKFARVIEFTNRRGLLGVLLFSIFPNPLLMPLLITMGINRFRPWKIAIACWIGHSVMFIIIALLGHFGLGSLLKYFGVFNVS